MATKKTTKSTSITDYKTKRVELRLNQSQFWSRLGVTQSGGSRYESGRTAPKPTQMLIDLAFGPAKEALKRLADLRGVSVDELVAEVAK